MKPFERQRPLLSFAAVKTDRFRSQRLAAEVALSKRRLVAYEETS